MHFHIITLFPEAFESYIDTSIIKRARDDHKIDISFYNPRDFLGGSKERADERPYGGGPGMVLRPEPIIKAIEHIVHRAQGGVVTKTIKKLTGHAESVHIVLTSARGEQFTNDYARNVAKKYQHVIIVCGRYEGVDARVAEVFSMDEVSIGPFVLTGGELPALVMMDAMARQVPGVLGTHESVEEERIAGGKVYTRPESFEYKGKAYDVPEVLRSGHHGKIDEYRAQ